MNNSISDLEKIIQVTFSDRSLFQNIFVHRSYLNEHRDFALPSNEKLEFLGDSVLSLSTSIYLYEHFPELKEGDYTDIKASIVRTESLAAAAVTLNLGSLLLLSKGEEMGNGRTNSNILADVFEALIAGIFIDKDFDTAYTFICTYLFTDNLDTIVRDKLYLSPKSRLQEYIQARHKVLPTYTIDKQEGPEHKKMFYVSVYINEVLLGKGEGASKKMAEEQAAKNAMDSIESKKN